jgi:uncharacterized phage protein gp47/JayE
MAEYKNKTISEIRDLIADSIQEKFNQSLKMLPKAFLRVMAAVFAGIFIVLYKQIGWLFLQLSPETANWGEASVLLRRVRPLVMWGRLIGVGDPKTGTQWRGTAIVKATGVAGTLIAGTQLKAEATGKLYITEESVPMSGILKVAAPLICAESGEAGNLDAGDVLSFTAPLGIAEKTAEAGAAAEYGTDDETEAEYRARVVARFRSPPLGGALSDYRRWADDVPGVLNTYPYKEIETPSGVLLFVSGVPGLFPDRVPTPELLAAVGKACTYDPETGKQSRKPVTAVLDPDADDTYPNVRPVRIIPFDVHISGVAGVPASDFAKAARPALENYFLGREPYIRGLSDDNNKTNTVSKNNVSTQVDQAAVSVKAEFDSALLYKDGLPVAGYELGEGELAKLNNLFINGEAA